MDVPIAIGSVEDLETSLDQVTGMINLSILLECKLWEIIALTAN